MIVLRKAKTFVSLPPSDALILVEALFGLAVARIVIKLVPFRIYARWLDHKGCHGTAPRELLRHVRWAIVCGARTAPFEAKCLPQAMAAKWMLARRRHASVLHLGVNHLDGRLQAHAWLTVGAMTVVGGHEESSFGVVARFGSQATAL